MRGISKKKLPELLGKIADQSDNDGNINYLMLRKLLLNECRELQEPWMTLDEFLKSEYRGLCWITLKDYPQTYAIFDGREFNKEENLINDKIITHVMPIHKPEPPK